MSNLRKVTKQEFDDFIKTYPRKLNPNTVRICEPPLTNFLDDSIHSDHELGSIEYYYDKVVASIYQNWMKDGEITTGNKFWEYSILSEK